MRAAWLARWAVLAVVLVGGALGVSGAPIIASAGVPDGRTDVDPSGACKADAATYCRSTKPGDGRLAACLTKELQDARRGNTAGRELSDACVDALVEFRVARSANINLDVPLARACKDDVAKACGGQSDADDPGSVVACLRGNMGKLSPGCSKEVARTQLEAADDYRFDAQLRRACEASVDSLCAGVEPGEGRELDCLAEKVAQLGWGCMDQLLRFQKEAADDIRLSVRLFKRCVSDQRRFCPDVEPGHMRVQECLEDHLDDEGFSPGCRKELDDIIARRTADFRIDPGLQEACEGDLEEACATSVDDLKDDAVRASAVKCLQAFRDELKAPGCADQVRRQMARAGRDIRFADVLAKACQQDRKAHCADVQPGSARVIRCLEENRDVLSQQCSAALFDHEVLMAESIDFQWPMRKACAWEAATFCAGMPHGQARVIGCLQKHLSHEDMSKECRDEVSRGAARAASDYRLNFRLRAACDADIPTLCGGLCPAAAAGGGGSGGGGGPCGGVVLSCLSQKQDSIASEACRQEVFYYELMEVTDFRNDVILAEACRSDVEKYCKEVEPGEGRVHACLRHQMNYLSGACAAEEAKLAAVEYRDIRLRPKLAKACSEERAVFCRDVRPGGARVVKCLMEAAGRPNFGAECADELRAREDAVKSDYRYDVGVLSSCANEVDQLCAGAKTKLRGSGAVLQCLVDSFGDAGDTCQAEVSRAARFALWDYAAGSPLTAACDEDVARHCPTSAAKRAGGAFTIGAAGHCLAKALAQARPLAPRCRALALAAAPRGAREYLGAPQGTGALVARLSAAQRAAGLEGVLLDPYAAGAGGVGAVTVTGWAALACVASSALVGVAALVMAYRRAAGLDRPHVQYLKSGDA